MSARVFYGSVRGEIVSLADAHDADARFAATFLPHRKEQTILVAIRLDTRDASIIGKFVELEGRLCRNDNHELLWMEADHVRVVPESPMTWQEMRGFMPEITDGLSVEDYLARGERGEADQ